MLLSIFRQYVLEGQKKYVGNGLQMAQGILKIRFMYIEKNNNRIVPKNAVYIQNFTVPFSEINFQCVKINNFGNFGQKYHFCTKKVEFQKTAWYNFLLYKKPHFWIQALCLNLRFYHIVSEWNNVDIFASTSLADASISVVGWKKRTHFIEEKYFKTLPVEQTGTRWWRRQRALKPG